MKNNLIFKRHKFITARKILKYHREKQNTVVKYLSGLCEQHSGGDTELTVVKSFNNGYNTGCISSSSARISKYRDKNMFLHIKRTRVKRPRPVRPRKPKFLCRQRSSHEFS